MLEVVHTRVPDGSVRQSLSQMRGEFLPNEIREDESARWVMDFDDLRQREGSSGMSWENSRESDYWALDMIVTSTLQRQIPFYFASLFHIGRQWKVSESAAGAVEEASSSDNLDASAKLTLANLRLNNIRDKRLAAPSGGIGNVFTEALSALLESLGQRKRGKNVVTEALSILLKSSRQRHLAQLQESRRWWTEWRGEVQRLREQVNLVQELARGDPNYRLWREIATFAVQPYRPSQLRTSMEAAGVTFLTDRSRSGAAPAYPDLMWPLLVAASGFSKSGDPFAHELMFEFRDALHDVNEETRFGDLRRVALERLRQKYLHIDDPFEPYMPLRKPASEELRNLIIANTLPGYGEQRSPWLAAWKRCVEYNPSSALKVPAKGKRGDWSAKGFARSADSAIKDQLPDHFLPGETWNDLVQRLFENAWISTIADQIAGSNKEAGDNGWTFAAFVKMIEGVVAILNEIGYRLSAPSGARLKKLWERLHSDKRWTSEEW
jgi:hypothetical protein